MTRLTNDGKSTEWDTFQFWREQRNITWRTRFGCRCADVPDNSNGFCVGGCRCTSAPPFGPRCVFWPVPRKSVFSFDSFLNTMRHAVLVSKSPAVSKSSVDKDVSVLQALQAVLSEKKSISEVKAELAAMVRKALTQPMARGDTTGYLDRVSKAGYSERRSLASGHSKLPTQSQNYIQHLAAKYSWGCTVPKRDALKELLKKWDPTILRAELLLPPCEDSEALLAAAERVAQEIHEFLIAELRTASLSPRGLCRLHCSCRLALTRMPSYVSSTLHHTRM